MAVGRLLRLPEDALDLLPPAPDVEPEWQAPARGADPDTAEVSVSSTSITSPG